MIAMVLLTYLKRDMALHYINNPGFQGIVSASQVPIPATIYLLGAGFVGIAGLKKKVTSIILHKQSGGQEL